MLASTDVLTTFLVVGHQVCTHLRRDFGPLLFADPLQILKVAFSMSWLREGGSRPRFHGTWPHTHSPLDAVESSCTLGRETAPKHNVSTSILDGGDGVIFSILPPPNAASRVDAKELDFGLICPHPVSQSSLESSVHWQTSDGPVHVLPSAGGTCEFCST